MEVCLVWYNHNNQKMLLPRRNSNQQRHQPPLLATTIACIVFVLPLLLSTWGSPHNKGNNNQQQLFMMFVEARSTTTTTTTSFYGQTRSLAFATTTPTSSSSTNTLLSLMNRRMGGVTATCGPKNVVFSSSLSKLSTTVPLLRRRTATAAGSSSSRSRTAVGPLNMFMGSDGGILGIGTPELLTILLVGYFVLGPSDLYKLTKEIGKFVQNIRTFGTDLSKTVENNLESQLQLDELRKAQRELNDAFSFRRSINNYGTNVNDDESGDDGEGDFPTLRTVDSERITDNTTTTTATSAEGGVAAAPTKKIRKRRVKRVVPPEQQQQSEDSDELNGGVMATTPTSSSSIPDWEAPFAVPPPQQQLPGDDWSAQGAADSYDMAEQRRFQAQMDVEAWNAQIMAATASEQQQQQQQVAQVAGGVASASFVLTKIMERLELLEEEKNAADALLQEEFRLRADTEERYYREKRQILEEAAMEVEDGDKYTTASGSNSNSNSPNTSTIV